MLDNARWITCDSDEPRHPIFSKGLPLAGEVASAELALCGLGLFDAYIDGHRVGDEHLAPGTCAYDKWLQVYTHDVTALLRKKVTGRKFHVEESDGKKIPRHEVEVLLGNGWYKGRFGFGGRKPYYGDSWRLIAEVRVRYADGREDVFGTDDTWQVTRSNITFSNIYDGERRDDTLPPVAPVMATLLPDEEDAAERAKLSERWSVPVTEHEEMHAAKLVTPKGDQVLDLGQEIAGTFRLRVHEPAGTRIRLQFGELLQDGEFYRDNLRSARAEYVYVSDGAERVLQPHFTYYGYRYVRVEGIADVDPADFVGVVIHSDFDAFRGTVETGDSAVNKLVENTRWGMRDNFVDTATDCPQRDERMGWTGDAAVFSPTALYLGDPYAFYCKYLHDMALEQQGLDGMVPGVVPSFGMDLTGAVWGDATTIIPWNMYVFDGDDTILREHFGAMRAWVDWIEREDQGELRDWGKRFQFGDWLALDGRKTNDKLGGTDEGLIAYVYYWQSLEIVAKSARVIGREAEAAEYARKAAELRAYIESTYYSASGRCCDTTQTAYVVSLAFGFGDRAYNAHELQRRLQENGGKLTCGFVGTPLLCLALSKGGLSHDAYDLLLSHEYPGWLFEVDRGATTVWERWNSLDEDGHITGTDMNSLNHYAYGSVVEWIFSHAAGLRPQEERPGFARATVAPEVSWRLGHLDCAYRSAAGTWRVAWRCLDERHLCVELTVPEGAMADVTLPLAPESAYDELGGCELGGGTYAVEYETTEPVRWTPNADWTVNALLAHRSTETVLRRFARHPEFLPAGSGERTVRELAGALKLDDERLGELDQALRALAE